MRTPSFIILVFTASIFGCGQNQSFKEHASSKFYSNNEDHFGFLVFDKAKIDTFFNVYLPIQLQNDKLKNAFTQLQGDDTNSLISNSLDWSSHTDQPKQSDYELAKNVFKAFNEKDDEKYFHESLTYLFFFDCLPDYFQNKWAQKRLGDFEFNVSFFNRLRTQCKVFDKIIYGEIGYWDKNIQFIFKHDIFNEINRENAEIIKKCIVQDTAFNDNRLKADKSNFLMFLEMVVQNKWRLFLIDKN